jgi:hypothetical protein
MRSRKITQSARDEDCTLNIAGACNYDSATVIFAHFPDENHGIGRKASDLSGAYCCSACHDVIDRRDSRYKESETDRDFYMRRAQSRTINRLIEKGILAIR